MLLKESNMDKSHLTKFDLYGRDEVALSKAFSYLISTDKRAFNAFLRLIKVDYFNFKRTVIEREVVSKEGRTDIELSENDTLLIIECKIGENRVKEQFKQYLKKFKSRRNKIMCFVTQERIGKCELVGVESRFTTWIEIINCFATKELLENSNVKEFIEFAHRRFHMREDKTILIQDLGSQQEISRFKEYNIYTRPEMGTASYFAPYFTRNSKQQEGEGISYIAKVLGVLSINPKYIEKHKSELERFADLDSNSKSKEQRDLVSRWLKGIKTAKGARTFYFLDKPLKIKIPLLKDAGIKKGRGKDWIAAMIPPNRKVDFISFLKHIPETIERN